MSRLSHLAVTALTLLALSAVPVRSSAEPIEVPILSGRLAMDGSSGWLSLVGDHGFTFEGGVSSSGGIFGPQNSCRPCAPGAPIDLFAFWSDTDLSGTATFQGVIYQHVGSGNNDLTASGQVTFSGSAVAPLDSGLTSTVVAPFGFTGLFHFPPTDSAAAATGSLLGGGTATLVLSRLSSSGPWSFTSATYEFAPVPEPGTLLLVGSVLGGLALRRFRPS